MKGRCANHLLNSSSVHGIYRSGSTKLVRPNGNKCGNAIARRRGSGWTPHSRSGRSLACSTERWAYTCVQFFRLGSSFAYCLSMALKPCCIVSDVRGATFMYIFVHVQCKRLSGEHPHLTTRSLTTASHMSSYCVVPRRLASVLGLNVRSFSGLASSSAPHPP